MTNKNKKKEAAVKIDYSLLGKIDKIINSEENKLRFANKKQFVDIAVIEYLNKLQKHKNE
ncbi:MAG: hypothetical protein ACOCUU_01040 [Nanoarchaeota archaeon]